MNDDPQLDEAYERGNLAGRREMLDTIAIIAENASDIEVLRAQIRALQLRGSHVQKSRD